jgi:hypothetical protein
MIKNEEVNQTIYVLGVDRASAVVSAFLDHFLPIRARLDEDYPFPQFSRDPPLIVFSADTELISYLADKPKARYQLYWGQRSTDIEVAIAMLFYIEDGAVIFGLAVESTKTEKWTNALVNFLGAEYFILGWEQPSPETAKEFIEFATRIAPSSIDTPPNSSNAIVL